MTQDTKNWLSDFLRKALWVVVGGAVAGLIGLAWKGYEAPSRKEIAECYVRKDILEVQLRGINDKLDATKSQQDDLSKKVDKVLERMPRN